MSTVPWYMQAALYTWGFLCVVYVFTLVAILWGDDDAR